MRYIFYCVVLILPVLTGCLQTSYEKNSIPDRIGGSPHTLILNYENSARQCEQPVINSHMMIYIEIEKPYVISIPETAAPDVIYSISPIEGTVVYRVRITESGQIISSEKKLSAGLGLDEIAENIFRQIKIEPSYLAGKSFISSADIRISFRVSKEE